MKIIDREAFLALPAGTVYAKWGQAGKYPRQHDLTYQEVAVKGETCGRNDWVEEPFLAWPEGCEDSGGWADMMEAAINGQPTPPLMIGDCGGRDGLFDNEQLFAVFDRTEVERLVRMLQESLATAYAGAASQ